MFNKKFIVFLITILFIQNIVLISFASNPIENKIEKVYKVSSIKNINNSIGSQKN